jgi:hypothetical protein
MPGPAAIAGGGTDATNSPIAAINTTHRRHDRLIVCGQPATSPGAPGLSR